MRGLSSGGMGGGCQDGSAAVADACGPASVFHSAEGDGPAAIEGNIEQVHRSMQIIVEKDGR